MRVLCRPETALCSDAEPQIRLLCRSGTALCSDAEPQIRLLLYIFFSIWCQLVPIGANWCQLVPIGANCEHKVEYEHMSIEVVRIVVIVVAIERDRFAPFTTIPKITHTSSLLFELWGSINLLFAALICSPEFPPEL